MVQLAGAGRLQQVVELAEGAPSKLDSIPAVQIVFGKGVAQMALRRFEASIDTLRRSGSAAREMGWLGHASRAYNRAGLAAFRGELWAKAADAWVECLRVERAVGSRANLADILTNIGLAKYRGGSADEALEFYRHALTIARDTANDDATSRTLYNAGLVHASQGKLGSARRGFEEALAVAEKAGLQGRIANVLHAAGDVDRDMGDYNRARVRYLRSLRISRSRRNRRQVAETLNSLGTLYRRVGDLRAATKSLVEALAIKRKFSDPVAVAVTLGNLGNVHMLVGEYAKSLALQDESLEMFRRVGHRSGIATALSNVGVLHLRLGRYSTAVAYFEQSLEASRAIEAHMSTAIALTNIANGELLRGRFAVALKRYEQAAERYRVLESKPGMATSLLNMAVAYRRSGKLDQARGYTERALSALTELQDRHGMAMALCNLGNDDAESGDLSEALRRYQRALEISREISDHPGVVRALGGIAIVRMRELDVSRAIQLAREGVELHVGLARGLTEREARGARDAALPILDAGALSALRGNRLEDLHWFLEQGRANALRDGLVSREAIESVALPDELRGKLAFARAVERTAIARDREGPSNKTRGALDRARLEVARLENRVRREAKAAATLSMPSPDSLVTVQARLASDEAFVFYLLTSAEALALVVTPRQVRAVGLVDSSLVEEAVHRVALQSRLDSDHLDELRSLLIEPLALPPTVARVFVSPAGVLCNLPYGVLFPAEVAVQPSATTHGLLTSVASKRGHGVLALGDPKRPRAARHHLYGNRGLESLPDSGLEARGIGTSVLTGAHATESEFAATLAERPRWRAVHFACHALVDLERPGLSALVLAPDDDNDGFLTALEVFRMKIPADLVVLSACQTATGKMYTTEGVVGLARAFMFAGAPRVLCSLWKVDDEATRVFMERFYALWNPRDGTGVGAAAALRAAQEHVRTYERDIVDAEASALAGRRVDRRERPWAHPRFWAAWVLWGLAN